jgi:hypothetical protein
MKKGVKMPEENPGFGWRVTALIFGIASLVLAWVPFLGILLSIISIIFSIIGMRKSTNKGMAIAGLVLGIIALIISLISTFIIGGLIYLISNANFNSTINESAIPVYKQGEKLVMDDIEYTINSVTTAEKISHNGSEYKAQGILVIINLTLENIDKKTKNLYGVNAQVVDRDFNQFASSSPAENLFPAEIKWSFQLQPKMPIKTLKIFDIPKTSGNLKLQITGGSFFSPKKARIELGV